MHSRQERLGSYHKTTPIIALTHEQKNDIRINGNGHIGNSMPYIMAYRLG